MNDDFQLAGVSRSLPPIKVTILPQDALVAERDPRLGPLEIELPGEACLGPGPTSARFAVVDYDADLDEVFAPAEPLANGQGFKGIRRGRLDHVFRQVNVWGVLGRTLAMLEDARVFGRRIPWATGKGRLLVLPHAGYWENAYYDRASGGLHFFYFESPSGRPIYTCLSHDIVTHELGHAVLDGLKPQYNELDGPETAGFHEYFGDAVALISAMSHRELMVAVAGRSQPDFANNPIAQIAAEFGRALSEGEYGSLARDYLRTATNQQTMADLAGSFEEHDYSEVLTGAFYDFLQAAYHRRLATRLAGGRRRPNGGDRVGALISAANLTGRMMFRALDYCPPVAVDYLDYARAVLRADETAYPGEPGFRELAAGIFERRGICRSRAELEERERIANRDLRGLDFDALSASRSDAYDFLDRNRAILRIPALANLEVVAVYRTKKVSANDYRPPQEIVLEFVWAEDLVLKGAAYGDLSGATMPLWCGGTLVFNRDGNLLHYVLKADDRRRRRAFLDYVAYLVRNRMIGLDDGEKGIGARALGANRMLGRMVAGRLHIQRSPAFRHAGRN